VYWQYVVFVQSFDVRDRWFC